MTTLVRCRQAFTGPPFAGPDDVVVLRRLVVGAAGGRTSSSPARTLSCLSSAIRSRRIGRFWKRRVLSPFIGGPAHSLLNATSPDVAHTPRKSHGVSGLVRSGGRSEAVPIGDVGPVGREQAQKGGALCPRRVDDRADRSQAPSSETWLVAGARNRRYLNLWNVAS